MKSKSGMGDVKEWAKREVSARGGFKCSICTSSPKVKEIIRTVAEMRAAGESQVSQVQLIEYVEKECGVAFSKTTMSNHIANHLKMKWTPDGR